MSATTNDLTTQAAEPRPHEPMELARYTIPEGERILIGRRVKGSAIVVDIPAGETGRVYLVEREVQHDGRAALNAMIADYVDQAERYGAIPMLATGSHHPEELGS